MSVGATPVAARTTQHAHFFANAAKPGNQIYSSLPNNVWFQRFVFTLQTFAIPFAYYFRPLCVALALFWQVNRKHYSIEAGILIWI
jgi:hypothetical protein